ncbi:TIGR00269 family protein [Candidatus Bathyarchaeota archaeon]|nr:TIGR00269 family protein [Candidatus Bathyarchaeota archaeon]
MLRFDDRLAVAVSGGKDSVSLLHILAKLEQKHPKSSLVAITVDEGIKGYRDEALKIAAANCEKLGIEHHVVSFKEIFGCTLDELVKLHKTNQKKRFSSCAYCGILRRKALNLAARHVDARKIATAHTLDDEVQTILLNIFHGDVLRIAREKPVTDAVHGKLVRRIKPFCEIPEKEVSLYAFIKKIKFQSIVCPYASEALRNDIRTMLNRVEERHAGIKFTIFNSIERIRFALEQVDSKERLGECEECGEPASEKLCKTCQIVKETLQHNRHSN